MGSPFSFKLKAKVRAEPRSNEIGCILVAEPSFFEADAWIDVPRDWPPANPPQAVRPHTGRDPQSTVECANASTGEKARRGGWDVSFTMRAGTVV
jgi:hypothetical protein